MAIILFFGNMSFVKINLKEKVWYDYVDDDIVELLNESLLLTEAASGWNGKFHDYSFVVFPAAKAYEGFLKKLFLDLGFITKEDYYGKRFRIGKALNPNLESELRAAESVYDRLVHYCGGRQLADRLWNTWKECRNTLFHWFPDEKTVINFEEAERRVAVVVVSIDKAFDGCKIKR